MREFFRGFYRPTPKEAADLWQNGLVVLDTNVLLSLYEYSEQTRTDLLRLMAAIGDRLWIPFQVAAEFQENRLNRITQALEARVKVAEDLSDLEGRIQKTLAPLDAASVKSLEQLRTFVERRVQGHREVVGEQHGHDDDIRADLDRILNGKIGSPVAGEDLEEMVAEGRSRIEARIPPGYADKGQKSEGRETGDYLVWRQTLDHAAAQHRPVIFVTEERKEDWWHIHKGKIVGPRPELVEEFWSTVGCPFALYRPDSFLLSAKKNLNSDVSDDLVSEVQLVSDRLSAEEEAKRQRREAARRQQQAFASVREVERAEAEVSTLTAELSSLSAHQAHLSKMLNHLAENGPHEGTASERYEFEQRRAEMSFVERELRDVDARLREARHQLDMARTRVAEVDQARAFREVESRRLRDRRSPHAMPPDRS